MEKGSQIVSGQHLENMNAGKTTAGVKKINKVGRRWKSVATLQKMSFPTSSCHVSEFNRVTSAPNMITASWFILVFARHLLSVGWSPESDCNIIIFKHVNININLLHIPEISVVIFTNNRVYTSLRTFLIPIYLNNHRLRMEIFIYQKKKTIFVGVICVCAQCCPVIVGDALISQPWKESRSSITNTSKNWDRQNLLFIPSNSEMRHQSQRLQIAVFCLTNSPNLKDIQFTITSSKSSHISWKTERRECFSCRWFLKWKRFSYET